MCLFSPNACSRIVAVALLVASAFSAGLSHAHPGGNLAHEHHAARWVSPTTGASPAAGELRLFAAQPHTHVYLLGFEFTVPAEEQSNEDPSTNPDLVVMRLVGDDFDMSLRAPTIDWLATPDAAILLAPSVADSGDCATAAIAVLSAPLCDSARHERTGVLRI